MDAVAAVEREAKRWITLPNGMRVFATQEEVDGLLAPVPSDAMGLLRQLDEDEVIALLLLTDS